MLTDFLRSPSAAHLASLLSVGGLVFRDQVKLRLALLASMLLGLIHFIDTTPAPDWQDLFWHSVSLCINVAVLARIIWDRTPANMTEEEHDLFSALATLSPGEFRTLLKLAAWRSATTEVTLTREAVVPHSVYYVLRGEIVLEKGGRTITAGAKTFIGEVAFLHRSPASATVRIMPGTRYLEWPVRKLDKLIDRRSAFKQAFTRLISLDMASKVARA